MVEWEVETKLLPWADVERQIFICILKVMTGEEEVCQRNTKEGNEFLLLVTEQARGQAQEGNLEV